MDCASGIGIRQLNLLGLKHRDCSYQASLIYIRFK